MKNYRNNPAVQEIYNMLYFYLMKTTLRLLPFMDRSVSPPTSFEIADVIRSSKRVVDIGTRIIQGRPLPEQQQTIELSELYTGIIDKYDLEEIRDTFEDWGNANPDGHNLLWQWSRKGTNGLKTMADIAERNGYSYSSTPYKLRDKYLEEIAFNVFMRYTSKKQFKKMAKK